MTDDECEADDQRRQRERFRPVERARREDGHAIIMMTCKGRGSLRERALSSIGDPRRSCTLVCDGHEAIYPRRWWTRDYPTSKPVGQAQTFFHALKLATAEPGFTKLTLLEDDIVVARSFLDYVDTTKIPDDIVLVSWFNRFVPHPVSTSTRWMIDRAVNHIGNMAITMPASTVYALLVSPKLKAWSEPHGADVLLGQVMPDALVAHHFPNIIDHVGGNASCVGNTGARDSPTFVGENFDALDLTARP
jgi:hypothetical protein